MVSLRGAAVPPRNIQRKSDPQYTALTQFNEKARGSVLAMSLSPFLARDIRDMKSFKNDTF